MTRRIKPGAPARAGAIKNSTLSATIQRTNILRRHCIAAYQTTLRTRGIALVTRVNEMIPDFPGYYAESDEHRMVSNFAFFASNTTLGERAAFVRSLHRAAPWDLQQMRSALMVAPLAAWRRMSAAQGGDDTKPTWELVGPQEVISLHYSQTPYEETPRVIQPEVLAVSDASGAPIKTEPGEVRVGWMVGLETLQPARSLRMREQMSGRFALLFSMPLQPESVARLERALAEERWHAPSIADGEARFFPADYERDMLTQAVHPGYDRVGLDEYYFLPLRIRKTFPGRFRRELLRRLKSAYPQPGGFIWHRDLARAYDLAGREAFFSELDQMRQKVEARIHKYSSESVGLPELRHLFSDEELLQVMGAGPAAEIELGKFGRVDAHPVELLGLDDEWLKAQGVAGAIHIAGVRRVVGANSAEALERFEEAVGRHIVRLRWVALMKARAADPRDEPELALPGYNILRHILQEIFDPVLVDAPLREVFAFLKARLDPLLQTVREDLNRRRLPHAGDPTLGDLPPYLSTLAVTPGIGDATLDKLERALLDEMLAWPRALHRLSGDQQLAHTQIDQGLDDLADFFD